MGPKTKRKCLFGGTFEMAVESQRAVRCGLCGASFSASPRENRRVAGEVIPGWTVRLPVHKEGESKD